jgi:uncharacterized protein YukE
MSGFIGADPADLDRLANSLASGASALDGLRLSLNSTLHSTPWHGARADAFRSEWESRHVHGIAHSVSALHDAERVIRQNAQEQRAASDSTAGAITHVPGVTGLLGMGTATHAGVAAASRAMSAQRLRQGTFYIGGAVAGLKMLKRASTLYNQGVSVERQQGFLQHGSVTANGSTSLHGVPLQGSATASYTASGFAHERVAMTKDGIEASVEAGFGVRAEASVHGSIGSQSLGVEATGHVQAEAAVNASGKAHIGLDGATAHGHVDAMAAVSADASATIHEEGVNTTGTVHAYAGVGVHADVDASVTTSEVKMSANIGAALGVGAGFEVKVDVKPAEVTHHLSGIYHHLIGA